MTRQHVCLFDIDGTLLDSGGAGLAAMEAALASEFGTTVEARQVGTAGRTDRAIVVDMMALRGLEESEEAMTRFIAAYLRHLSQTLRTRQGLVLPGIRELLEKLDQWDHVTLGLLTGNFREGADLKLGYYGLDCYFRFGGFGDHCLHRDDVAREALAEVHKHYNGSVPAERVWVVGDTPADVHCARAIGAKAVAVGTGIIPNDQVTAAAPDYFFEDFSHPEKLLALLTDQP